MIERLRFERYGRMSNACEEGQKTDQEPAWPVESERGNGKPQKPPDPVLQSSEDGVDEVATVELPEGHQIESGRQKTDFRCKRERMKVEDHLRGEDSVEETAQDLDRLTVSENVEGGIGFLDRNRSDQRRRRPQNAKQQEGKKSSESRKRTGNADVEELFATGNPAANSNEGSEGAD